MSEDVKTFVFPDKGFAGNAVDPNLMLAMNGGGGFGNMNSPFWAIILLAFLRNGFGWNGSDNVGSNAFVSSQLGQAIAGNANAISNLATSLNCTEGQIQTAIAGVQNSIQQVANANNMSAMQIVNAINMGNSTLANQLSSCCCDIKTAVTTGFGNLAYENAAQFCQTRQASADNTNRILAKIDAVQDEAKNNKIAELTAQLTAANSRAERQAELAPIYKQLNDIACKQPQTIPVQYQPFTAIPNCVAYQMGLYGGFPFSQNGSIWS